VTRLLLLRHAQSTWNAEGRWQGLADPPLSPWGEEQATVAGPLLRPLGISSVVSSNLRRARGTAERIAPSLDLRADFGPVLTVVEDLREYDVGAWSGLTRPQIEEGWPGAVEDWRRGLLVATPGGERNDHFVARISSAISRLAANRPGQTVLVITHGGVIGALSRSLGGPFHRFSHLSGMWIVSGPTGLHVSTEMDLFPSVATFEGPSAEVLDTPGL
jgi:probable phosphoglycerate mutase